MSKLVYVALFTALLGIIASVGFIAIQKQGHDSFEKQVAIFQTQTAVYDADRYYAPDEAVAADWTFQPIITEEVVTMTATFLFRNTDTDQIYLNGEIRVLPHFEQVQYQVSQPLTWSPEGLRKLTTAYHVPAQAIDGNYTIQICQQFAHNGAITDWSCYDGPSIKVKRTSE